MPINIPLTKLIFLEMIQLLAHNVLKFHNQRWIQIDIDDVFVAPSGFKPTATDVKVHAHYSQMVDTYNLHITRAYMCACIHTVRV